MKQDFNLKSCFFHKKEPRGNFSYRAAQAGGILESFRDYRNTPFPLCKQEVLSLLFFFCRALSFLNFL